MAKKTLLKVTAIAVWVILVGSFVRADLSDGLTAYWTFDEGSGGTAYDSAISNNGTINGAAWTTGRIGSALNFDGSNDFVSIPASPTLDFSQSYTISAWLKPTANPTQAMVWFGYHGGDPYGPNTRRVIVLRMYPNGSIRFGLYNDDLNTATGMVTFGEWNHIVIHYDYDTDTSAIYVNSQLKASGNNGPYYGGLRTATLGKWDVTFQSQEYFKGLMDEFMIYDRALSAEEIEQLYQLEIPELLSLEIVGPDQAAEHFSTRYQAIAHYDDNSTRDVTNFAAWSVEPEGIARVTAGLLKTEKIHLPTAVTLTAQYSQGDTLHEAQKDISILAICSGGSALQFDGVDDYVAIAGFKGVTGGASRTCSAWVKTSSVSDEILTWGSDDYAGARWVIRVNEGGQLRAEVQGGNIIGTTLINDDAWHHIAVAAADDGSPDISEVQLYVDGQLDTISAFVDKPINTSSVEDVHIGAYFAVGNPRYFQGLIDDVRIYNRALPAEDIPSLMHRRPDTSDPALVGYWDFDDAEGQLAADLSDHGNDGILGSTPDEDSSDPIWVASEAPIGICTNEGIIERNLTEVANSKLSILEQLYDTIAQEEALLDYMNETFGNRDFKNARKHPVVKAKQHVLKAEQDIRSAIKLEDVAGMLIDKSLDKLDDAMSTLRIEPDSKKQK